MNDLQTIIVIQFVLIVLLFGIIAKLKKRMDKFDQWADTVDEFIDGEYILLEIDHDKH